MTVAMLVMMLFSVVPVANSAPPYCPTWHLRREFSNIIESCSSNSSMLALVTKPYPWADRSANDQKTTATLVKTDLDRFRDPLDALNHVCTIYGRFSACVSEKIDPGVPERCLVHGFSLNYFDVKRAFDFICQQKRDTNLLRSLGCLHDTGVLHSLQLQAMPRFGIDFLQEQSNLMKNILFFVSDMPIISDIRSAMIQRIQKGFLCMPENQTATLLSPIGEKCGERTLRLIQRYLMYYKLKLVNLWVPSNITLWQICGSAGTKKSRIESRDQRKFSTNLDVKSFKSWTMLKDINDTSLNTGFGRYIIRTFGKASLLICSKTAVEFAYRIMLHLQYTRRQPVRFNLFHFVHGLMVFHPYSVPCENMDVEVVHRNWTLYQNMCPSVRGVQYRLQVLLGGCELYAYMRDNYGHCQWEEILLKIYKTVALSSKVPATDYWLPGAAERLILDGLYEYYDMNQWLYITKTLDILHGSLDEISTRCGHGLTKKLQRFYQVLKYTVLDSIAFRKYFNS